MTTLKNNLSGFLLLVILFIPTAIASAQENAQGLHSHIKLIMFQELGCQYCERWNAEIGVIYSKTPEGQFAPLMRVFRDDSRTKHIANINYSPTFVIMRDDREIGRIVGYPGEEFFWAWLKEILEKAGFKPVS